MHMILCWDLKYEYNFHRDLDSNEIDTLVPGDLTIKAEQL